ncbi:MAG: glycosyltransferase family protein [Thermoplasmataceae archaeon]
MIGLISLLYLLILLFYTHGALLFDGDNAGFYHLNVNLFETPTGMLNVISLILAFGNIYVAFYINLYFSLFLAMIAIFYLSIQVYRIVLPSNKVMPAALLSAILYVIAPFILTDYYNTFILNVSLMSSIFTLFLAFLFRLIRTPPSAKREFLKNIVISAIFLGLSLTGFPNAVRILIVGYSLFVLVLTFIILRTYFYRNKIRIGELLEGIAIFVAISVISSLYNTYSLFFNIGATTHLANVAASNFIYLGFYTGKFNTITQVIRLLGTWSFPTSFVIYHKIYYRFNIVNVASYFWPILALVFPLIILLKTRKFRGFLILIMVIMLASIFWEKGANPPLGSLWYFINNNIPFGYQLIPTGFLNYMVLVKLYPVMAVFSIFTIYGWIRSSGHLKNKIKIRKLLSIIPIFLVVMLVVAEMPLFDGQLEENYFNDKSSGFFIPSNYASVREYILKNPGSVLFLPGVQAYITTNWNYSGSSGFFNAYFQPVKITNVNTFGGAYSSSHAISAYVNLTSPLSYNKSSAYLNTTWLGLVSKYKFSYILVDYSLKNFSYFENYTYTKSAINMLIKNGIVSPVLQYSDLALYVINYSKFPVHV